MRYADGNDARIGGVIAIGGKHRGTVVACIDRGEFSDGYPAAQWSYLGKGILVDTDFGGIVPYLDENADDMMLVRRAK